MAEFEVDIDKVGFQGDGLTADGVVVAMTLPGERVRVATHRDKDGKERTDIVEILKASSDRVTPPCRHFATCGGCALQHWDLEAYGAWKREVVEVQLTRAGLETEVAPILMTPPASRRRVGLHARKVSLKKDAPVELGYKMRRSWSLVPIVECPIADPAIVQALPRLKEMARGLFEHAKSAPILHVTASQTGLDIDISGVERSKSGGLSADACMQIAMVAGEANFARVTMGDDIVYEARKPRVTFGRGQVGLPPGSFLQASAKSEADMVRLVVEAVQGAKVVADLFCGAGTFTFPLAEVASVRAADGAAKAIAALKTTIATAPGLKGISPEVRDLFRRPLMAPEMKGLDAVVFDPPRAGAEAQAHEIAQSAVSKVVAVSCNPTTFIRDAKILTAAGFSLDKVTPIDQFLWSPHVELVAIFSR